MTATSRRYRAVEQVHARRFDEDTVLLDLNGGTYYSLNDVGSSIWESATSGATVEESVARVVLTYEIDAEKARADVERLLADLVSMGLLVEVET